MNIFEILQVKSDLAYVYKLSKTDLGWLDTALLLPYAVMQVSVHPT